MQISNILGGGRGGRGRGRGEMDKGVSRGTGFLSELIFDTEVAGNIQISMGQHLSQMDM